MRRFFINRIKSEEGEIRISGSEARHITKVLRMGPGDRFVLLDGQGDRCRVRIKSCARQEVLVSLEKRLDPPPTCPIQIILCQAILKAKAMDYAIQKASELGIYLIVPFFSERTIVKLRGERLSNKRARWGEIAHGSAKQSDRLVPVEIGEVISFQDLISRWGKENALKTILWEDEGAKDLKDVLRTTPLSKRFVGIVGPEGGFTDKEIHEAGLSGFTSVSLGHRVLRAETAAVAFVSILQYEWGDLSLRTR